MILIEDGENVKLSGKYHKINNLCAFIYDQMTEIYVDKNYNKLNYTKFNLTTELVGDFDSKKEQILEFLKEKGLNDELTIILTKHITLSVLSDMLNFIYESLSCAKKGKMTVAYALLRKPFTDELLILEQILHNPTEFINRFFYIGSPEGYDPSLGNIDKKKIIEDALIKIRQNNFFSADLIHTMRFDKASKNGLNWISNHALHIVTKDKNYKTQSQNLNFVFSNQKDIGKYWSFYYSFVPYLLTYTAAVVDTIIFQYLPDESKIKAIKSLKRQVGLILWHEEAFKKNSVKKFKSLSVLLNLKCEICNTRSVLTKVQFELFFKSETLCCNHCTHDLLKFNQNIENVIDYTENM